MKVGIIGFGRFGKTLYRLLAGHFDIVLFDKNREVFKKYKLDTRTTISSNLKNIYESQVIFYCVPISTFDAVIKKHKKYFRDSHTLIDTLSVKAFPEKIFSQHLKGTKTGAILTHPMFGPDSSKEGFNNLRIVMNQFKSDRKTYLFWKNYFSAKGLNIVELTSKEHDKLAARSQGVTHFIGRLLSEFKFSKTSIDTRGAEELQKVMEQTCNDSWELFNSLQNYNQYTKNMRIQLGRAYDRLYNKLLPAPIHKWNYKTFGIQGGIGSFNEQAILHYLKTTGLNDYKISYLYTSENVLKALYEGSIDYGLFATHNSIGGIVSESIKAMSRYKFTIVEEVVISIQHFLMKRKEITKDRIRKIMAHSQVFKQCKNTLSRNFPHLILESGKGNLVDTAKAAQALARDRLPKTTAILGPKHLSELYDLEIIAENLQDDKINNTSFLLVTR